MLLILSEVIRHDMCNQLSMLSLRVILNPINNTGKRGSEIQVHVQGMMMKDVAFLQCFIAACKTF